MRPGTTPRAKRASQILTAIDHSTFGQASDSAVRGRNEDCHEQSTDLRINWKGARSESSRS
jgi:hypothetical protein